MADINAVGVLGGTFDPVHNGHLAVARHALRELALDRVLLIPNGQPPHRAAPQASGAHRLAMLQLACAAWPQLQADPRELHRSGASYSVDTLAGLRAELGPQVALTLLLGADAFADIRQWSRWRQVFELAQVAVFARPGEHRLPAGVPAARVRFIDGEQIDISASMLRARLAAGDSCGGLLPDLVAAYIERHALYRATNCQTPGIGQ